MRLTPHEQSAIRQAVHRQDPAARVLVFGSRTDDTAKGGDIDLFIISDAIDMRAEWAIRRQILDAIGDQKLDLIVRRPDQLNTPISRLACQHGLPL